MDESAYFVNKKNIYITYCSKKKVDYSIVHNKLLKPEDLYISDRVQKFVSFCKSNKYDWGIFSDYYGFVFGCEEIRWYDKHPDTVTDAEYHYLLHLTLKKIEAYDMIFFYYNHETFHLLYQRLLQDLGKRKIVKLIDKLEEINEE